MNVNQIQTTVNLSQANFKIVKAVNGSCKRSYFLGLGGGPLKNNAVSDMLQNANLSGSQAIINCNVSIQEKFMLLGLFTEFTATATALVIEFTDGVPTSLEKTEIEANTEPKDTTDLNVDNTAVIKEEEPEAEISIDPNARLGQVLSSNVRKPFVWDVNASPVTMSVYFFDNGTIESIMIESSVSPEIDGEAMRLTKYAEKWVKLNLKKNKQFDFSKPQTINFFIKKA